MPEFLTRTPSHSMKAQNASQQAPHLLLAHGAGAPMTSAFMENITLLLSERTISTTRFEFAYMAQRRTGGSKRPPPPIEKLFPEFIEAIGAVRNNLPPRTPLYIGGKSMGGRIASIIAEELFQSRTVNGLVCLGYPFHPQNKPEKLRTAHLAKLNCPTLIVQGDRDPLGTRTEVESYQLASSIKFHWSGDGDHDLKPRARSPFTHDANLGAAADAIAEFLRK